MIDNDYNNELEVVRAYNDAIKLAREVDDQGTVGPADQNTWKWKKAT